jgi:hypothetical protein
MAIANTLLEEPGLEIIIIFPTLEHCKKAQ